MALPTRIHYQAPLPPHHALPGSRAPWQLDVERAAVLVHDMQSYFLRPYDPACPALVEAVAATQRVLAAARAAKVPVFYTAQHGNQDPHERGLQRELWGPGMPDVDELTRIIPELTPEPGDTVLRKHRYSAFQHSDFAERLRDAGRDQLVITGVYAHIGVTATAFEAFQREIQPFLVADAVADFSQAQHRQTLEQVADCCGPVMLADAVVERLSLPASANTATGWETSLQHRLAELLGDQSAATAFADPEHDLFHLGLNSIQAFSILDDLADAGVAVEFTSFTRRPTIGFLRETARAA